MDGPPDYHIKRSKSERAKQIPYDISYMCNLKYDTNQLTYKTNRLTDIENRLVVANGEEHGGVFDYRLGINRCKLSYAYYTIQHREQYSLSCNKSYRKNQKK